MPDGATEHRTYIERRGDGSFYWWCEADDCYAPTTGRRYATEREAYDAAGAHEARPG